MVAEARSRAWSNPRGTKFKSLGSQIGDALDVGPLIVLHSARMSTSTLVANPLAPAPSFAGQHTHGPRDRDAVRNGAASDQASDATLVQQLIAGSGEALAVLHDRYAPGVFA